MSSAVWRWISSLPPTDRSVPPSRPVPDGCIGIGSGEVGPAGVGGKAALLDAAAVAGIDVPAGIVVTDGSPLPDLTEWAGDRTLAVRSAFSAEDRDDASLAGWFETRLGVEVTVADEAFDSVRRSADRRDSAFRRDVLIMEMVDARHAGVAFSEPGTLDDLVNLTDGLADALVGGTTEGRRLELPRLEPVDEGWAERLQRLLRDVRTTFGDRPWDVEWADDDATCHLVQLRPITAPPRRDETLTAANHAEILPRLPSVLMASVIEQAGPALFDWYRVRLGGFAPDREFLHVVAGRPMINLSLLEDMMRHLGLPTRLVADSIGGDGAVERPAVPSRILRRSPSLARLGLAQVAAVLDSRRRRRRVAAIGSFPHADHDEQPRPPDGRHSAAPDAACDSFAAALDDLGRAYVALVTGMFPLSSAIGPPMALLRRVGTLYEHASRHRTITTELARRRAELRAGDASLSDFLDDFGHRGVYESDIARPRYADDPSTLEHGEATEQRRAGPQAAVPAPRRTLRGILTTPVWWAARAPVSARELLRHDAMRSFAVIRRRLVALADVAIEQGRLRSVDDLWDLDVDEVKRLDDGWAPDDEFWERRAARRREDEAIEVPHVVRRFDDPASWNDHDRATADDRLHGLPLTAGVVEGRAWVLDEPGAAPPSHDAPGHVVLVARSIDAGWIDTIGHADAVVVEIGGDLSHGSILVRELGVPAVTNVRGATRRIRTGDPVVVDADHGRVLLGGSTTSMTTAAAE